MKETLERCDQYYIKPQTGAAFTVDKGRIIRVIDSEMNLTIGLSACSAGKCNNFRCSPIRVKIDPVKG
jgi:uncharacterized protein YcgI (DUF1989 family)